MPFQALIDSLLHVPGVAGALLLDSEGEVAIQAGVRDLRHQLIGAYQGIAVATARRIHEQHGLGDTRVMACRYDHGLLIARPLKDGYYLVASLEADRPLAHVLRACDALAVRLVSEL
jgi:predicted regulator of Ras-like GTPase activity (Roadblock/LC7/MglB family)